jgi:hypothetical protein
MPGWSFAPTTFDDIVDASEVTTFQKLVRRKVTIAAWSISWHDGLRFPTSDVQALWRVGYVPQIRLFNWPVQDYAPVSQPLPPGPIANSDIAAGKHDTELRRFAAAARATNIPIEFDYDAEMQAAHPWGGRFDGGGTATGYGDPGWPDGPEHYRDAYRHIIDIFRQEGATNVTFIFQTNTIDGGYATGGYWEPWEAMKFYYPGDEYIDWLGLSAYAEPFFNVGPPQSFRGKLLGGAGYQGSYAEITALGDKPLMINEMGLYRMPSEQSKAQWVEDASAVLQSGQFPRVKGLVWWAQNKGGDYDAYPNTSPTFLDGYKRAFGQPFYDAKAQFGGNCAPLAPARVRLNKRTLSWTAVPNAAAYQVWRGQKKIASITSTSVRVAKPGPYRVRGVNTVGLGPFRTAR